MRQNVNSKIILTAVLVSILLVSLVSCSTKHPGVKQSKNPNKIVQDKDYTEDLKKENEVVNGQVYVQNGVAIATMIIKDNVSDEAAKKLAGKYAKELKETYKNMKVNVQAVKAGKNVANITLD